MTRVGKVILSRLTVGALVLGVVGANIYRDRNADGLIWFFRMGAALWATANVVDVFIKYRKVIASRKTAAKKIVDIRNTIYGNEVHQYRPVSLDDFPNLDRGFYEMSRTWFEAQGFTFAGDLENVTAGCVLPNSRSVLRFFLGDGGAIAACIFHLVLPPRKGSPHVRAIRRVELQSEFSDGEFIQTFAGSSQSPVYQGIVLNCLSPNASPEQVLLHHRAAIAAKLAEGSGVSAIKFGDVEGIIQMEHRQHSIKARQRRTADWGTEREAILGRSLTEREKAIADQIRRDQQSHG